MYVFRLTILGAIFTGSSVALLGVSLNATPDSRARGWANWWALTCAYFGVVMLLSRELLR